MNKAVFVILLIPFTMFGMKAKLKKVFKKIGISKETPPLSLNDIEINCRIAVPSVTLRRRLAPRKLKNKKVPLRRRPNIGGWERKHFSSKHKPFEKKVSKWLENKTSNWDMDKKKLEIRNRRWSVEKIADSEL